MDSGICIFKKKLNDFINKENMKIWLARKHGKRVECLFKIGQEQFCVSNKLVESKKYILFGQNIDQGLSIKLQQIFNDYLVY